MSKKETRGGKRPNAGRKKVDYKTETIAFRVREQWVDEIKLLVKEKVKSLAAEL
jgi:hypothetical protein